MQALTPRLVVVGATRERQLRPIAPVLLEMAAEVPVTLAGTPRRLADAAGLRLLSADLVQEADRVCGTVESGAP